MDRYFAPRALSALLKIYRATKTRFSFWNPAPKAPKGFSLRYNMQAPTAGLSSPDESGFRT